jgi:hypothetical protein
MADITFLTDEMTEVLGRVFYGRDSDKIAEFTSGTDCPSPKLVHYTSAQTAHAILTAKSEDDRCLWLRNATEMNDFMEVDYGFAMLREAFDDKELEVSFEAVLNTIRSGHFLDVFRAIGEEASSIKLNTYLLSLSKHSGPELEMGLLSMWRAYGGEANVCLVFNSDAFVNEQQAYDVVTVPVDYGGVDSVKTELKRIRDAMYDNRDVLRRIHPDIVHDNLKYALDIMLLSTKHPGFAEEKEWRILYRPPAPPKQPNVPSKIVCVNGIVQSVFYLPMKDIPEKGVAKANLNDLLHSIIIGPTPNPNVVGNAFIRLLHAAGIENAHERIKISGIPLRR